MFLVRYCCEPAKLTDGASDGEMDLSERESKLLDRAHRELKRWPYERAVMLVFGVGAFFLNFWLASKGEFALNPLWNWMQGLHIGIGIGFLAHVWRNWDAPKEKQLVKLANEQNDDAA